MNLKKNSLESGAPIESVLLPYLRPYRGIAQRTIAPRSKLFAKDIQSSKQIPIHENPQEHFHFSISMYQQRYFPQFDEGCGYKFRCGALG